MTGLNEPLPPHTSERQSDEELFSRTVAMAEVCQKLLNIERLQSAGLNEQNFYIGGIIVEAIQHNLNKKSSSEVLEELKIYSVFSGRTKVAEVKRVYRLCRELPKLRIVRSGFSPMELSRIKTLCLWSCSCLLERGLKFINTFCTFIDLLDRPVDSKRVRSIGGDQAFFFVAVFLYI